MPHVTPHHQKKEKQDWNSNSVSRSTYILEPQSVWATVETLRVIATAAVAAAAFSLAPHFLSVLLKGDPFCRHGTDGSAAAAVNDAALSLPSGHWRQPDLLGFRQIQIKILIFSVMTLISKKELLPRSDPVIEFFYFRHFPCTSVCNTFFHCPLEVMVFVVSVPYSRGRFSSLFSMIQPQRYIVSL